LLAAVQPGGKLLAVDWDPIELPKAEARLRALGFPAESLVVKRMNYAGVARFIAAEAPGGADVLLADLGLSSMQIDDPARGFTFKVDGPLDMRMNPLHGQPAWALLSRLSEHELAQLLKDNADEPLAGTLARAILLAHDRTPLTTTSELAAVVRNAMAAQSQHSRESPDEAVRRVFQALRIAVNDEIGSLNRGLEAGLRLLKPGGRMAVITFHSLEDRVVKVFGRDRARDYVPQGEVDVPELRQPKAPELRIVTRRAVVPGPEELGANPRSRSAQLRVFEKI